MKKILLVDDDPEIVALTKKRLETKGYRVVTAADGVEGIDMAREEDPDLIILDIIMPNKDGFTMLRELKSAESTSTIPVVMLTAKGETRSLMECKKYGIYDYFIKPFDVQELLKYIERYV